MKIVAVVQARMGSSRLPGKVLLSLGYHPVIEHVVTRLGGALRLDDLVVAIPAGSKDDPLEQACRELGVTVVRGPEDDVLERYRRAARAVAADVVVRVTADCPCLDAEVVDRVVSEYLSSGADYASNTLERTWPRGYDVEAFSGRLLEHVAAGNLQPYEREHVTPVIWQHPEQFRLHRVVSRPPCGHPDWRLCLDTAEDYAVLRLLWRGCADVRGRLPGAARVAAYLAKNPWLTGMNSSVRQQAVPDPAPARKMAL